MDSPALREALRRLAANHRWTWAPTCERLLFSLPGASPGRHPLSIVSDLADDDLDGLLDDDEFIAGLNREIADLDELLEPVFAPEVAYCSPEFGISAWVPQYSGGLGILAGDHLKAASDQGLGLVGVGLFYRQGYFTQAIADGGQSESYLSLTPEGIGATDTGKIVAIPLPGREVVARILRMDVGRVPLLLLDTDHEANSEEDRSISDRLYGGDRRHRLDQ
ncbi:MAG TPA: DUF3417 domain-containing protein, partial [Acidimicrobiia bacterium]